MSPIGRYCCKSRFALVCKNSAGRRRGFRVKMRGTSSPHGKLTGDFGKANEAIRISDRLPVRVFAKNWSPCNFGLLQQYLHFSDIEGAMEEVRFVLWCGHPPSPPLPGRSA